MSGKLKNFEKALNILKTYNGRSPYIYEMKKNIIGFNKPMNDFTVKYILENYEKEPEKVNKTIKISDWYGEELKQKFNISFVPEKIKVGYVIGTMGDTLHCYIKYMKRQENANLVFLPKKAMLDDVYGGDFNSIEINFDPYDEMTEKYNRKLKEHQKSGVKFLLYKKKAILADTMGTGKALPENTMLPSPNGYIKLKDVKDGTVLFSSNGNPTKVIGVYKQGIREIYRIELYDGTVTYSDIRHLWIVLNNNERKTMELSEIINSDYKNNDFYIPLCEPVSYNAFPHMVSPYKTGRIIYENLNNSKFIVPNEYIFDSPVNKSQLLQALLKNIEQNDDFSFTISTKSKNIASFISDIVKSISGIAKIALNDDTFDLTVYLPNENLYKMRKIINITKENEEEAICIKVDSEDESFLIKDYLVTHNTTTLTIAALAGKYKKILILCPASLKENWKNELMYYVDESEITIVNRTKWKGSTKFTIINYDVLRNFYKIAMEEDSETKKMVKSRSKAKIMESLSKSRLYTEGFDLIIVDECHKLSKSTSIRYKILEDFIKKTKIESIFLSTGTPITNNTVNLYNILKLIDADITKNYEYYMKRYCNAKKMYNKYLKRDVLVPSGSSNLDELKEKIKHLYIRRTAEDIGLDVEHSTTVLKYDLSTTQRITYNKLWNEYQEAQYFEGNDVSKYKQLIEGTILRQWAANEMIKNTIELAESHIEYGEKVLIMCCFDEEINQLKEHFGDSCVVFNGKMSNKQKEAAKNEFINDDKKKVFIGNIISAGVGLTLVVANVCIFNSFDWVTGNNEQAERRIVRIGQEKECEIYYQIFNDTIFEKMFNIVAKKKNIIETVIKNETDKQL